MADEHETIAWHAAPPVEVLQRLKASADGLDGAGARQRLEQTGPNALEAGEGVHPLRLLVRQVREPLV